MSSYSNLIVLTIIIIVITYLVLYFVVFGHNIETTVVYQQSANNKPQTIQLRFRKQRACKFTFDARDDWQLLRNLFDKGSPVFSARPANRVRCSLPIDFIQSLMQNLIESRGGQRSAGAPPNLGKKPFRGVRLFLFSFYILGNDTPLLCEIKIANKTNKRQSESKRTSV